MSLLNPSNFRFAIERAPYLSFFAQNVILPSISLGSNPMGTPFTDINYPGDHVEYDPLTVSFMVDEDLKGYIEMYNWIRGLGFPDSFDEYKAMLTNENFKTRTDEVTSNIMLYAMTGARNLNIKYTFVDAFPTNVGPILFNAAVSETPVPTCSVTFKYTTFTVETII